MQAGLNATLAGLAAALPDRVPVLQRARVAGIVGITQIIGTLAGTVVVTTLIAGIGGGYLACAVAVILGAVLFVARTPDIRLVPSATPGEPIGAALRGIWGSPRRHPDFAWAWFGHFCVQVGNALGVMYLLFFLTDVLRLPAPDAGLLIAMSLYASAVMVGAAVTGVLCDRSGRRKPYVVIAVLLMGAAASLLVVWQTWTVTMVAALALGLALLTQVLPAASARAKDLGIVNISNSLPQPLRRLRDRHPRCGHPDRAAGG